nr:40S ribosomal protein S13 [Ipomoea batatas]
MDHGLATARSNDGAADEANLSSSPEGQSRGENGHGSESSSVDKATKATMTKAHVFVRARVSSSIQANPSQLVKISSQDVEDNICKFVKRGMMTSSHIGVILRDSHGIAQVKGVTRSKILRILKAHGLALEILEDLSFGAKPLECAMCLKLSFHFNSSVSSKST